MAISANGNGNGSSNGNGRVGALVDTEWVEAHRNDPEVRLIEVDVNTHAYTEGHIPNAVGWDWRKDLQQRPARDIPSKAEWEALLQRSGVSNDTHVLLYGDNNNWFAAFAYWVFKLYGHERVSLIDGGRVKWAAEGRELTTDAPQIAPAAYRATELNRSLRAHRDHVERAVYQRDHHLIDVRSPGEFSGELLAPENLPQEGAQRGGHIPSAHNIPWATAVAADGAFKPVEELRAIYANGGPDTPAITYCRIGERSAHTWFVLTELLGHTNVRNYDGSWTEWGSLIGAPIER
ncbi:MAG: sulfurtransferase [Thermomicrobiales bacterium]